ncbi:n-acetyltransferase-related [Holotrichia oblita]|uniref:N-acetyltransferase-related n=2 Tax=Holotrichia oblita TaxID=644536 RepID=A0ACB9TBP2_HOLOL|nr:n-acetyltransferase-related [Holotrichia oblita]KAI4464227.1 n-acetyltransferase-related [Holotrichia oblita]
MSKRLRLENERVAAIKDEEREEEDKLKLIKERIYAPITWKRMPIGICIRDIKENDFQDVIDFLLCYYITEDVLCRNTEMIKDATSQKSFLEQCMYFLRDTSSIMAVDELKDNDIVGVILMRVVLKEDYGRVFARTIMLDGVAQKKCMQIKIALNRKVDIFADFDCESYLSIEAVSIKPAYRKRGIGFTMMRCAPDIARSLQIPVICGIFGTASLQRCAKKIGMEVQSEINYVEWRNKDKNLIIDDPGPGNYSCAIMAGRVLENRPEPAKAAQKHVEEEKKPKTTRKERRETAANKSKGK